MQIQRPNDKVTSLLIAESDTSGHFLRACKEINQSISSGWRSTSARLPLISLPFGLHICNRQESKRGAPKVPFPWVLFTSAVEMPPVWRHSLLFLPITKASLHALPNHWVDTWDLFPEVIKPESRLETKKVCGKATDLQESLRLYFSVSVT